MVAMRGEHEERLMPAVAELLSRGKVAVEQLDAVACGAGPGSFTSLRIAASIAKGLSVAREIPLVVAPSTLLVPAAAAVKHVIQSMEAAIAIAATSTAVASSS